MFGTKIRSWMEAHIVRPRKKQHRSKDAKKRYDTIDVTKDNNKDTKSSELTLMPVSLDAIEVSRFVLLIKSDRDGVVFQVDTSIKSDKNSLLEVTQKQPVTLRSGDERGRMQNNNNNLSSPESAYSTGYSTDGTSPGASFPATTAPPEYYINIRTGIKIEINKINIFEK